MNHPIRTLAATVALSAALAAGAAADAPPAAAPSAPTVRDLQNLLQQQTNRLGEERARCLVLQAQLAAVTRQRDLLRYQLQQMFRDWAPRNQAPMSPGFSAPPIPPGAKPHRFDGQTYLVVPLNCP